MICIKCKNNTEKMEPFEEYHYDLDGSMNGGDAGINLSICKKCSSFYFQSFCEDDVTDEINSITCQIDSETFEDLKNAIKKRDELRIYSYIHKFFPAYYYLLSSPDEEELIEIKKESLSAPFKPE